MQERVHQEDAWIPKDPCRNEGEIDYKLKYKSIQNLYFDLIYHVVLIS